MPIRIEATYRAVTPLFCAGADPKRPEIRLPSFKGVLRYWWRALAWSRYRGDLGKIQQQEDTLFGSAGGGQSRVSMRLPPASTPQNIRLGEVRTVPPASRNVAGEGARYLGYGVMEAFGSKRNNKQAGERNRGCLRAPFDFTVRMRARDLDEQNLQSLTEALVALGTLGGMGAKSRKGYGSLVLQSLRVDGKERWDAPQSVEDLRDVIERFRCDGKLSALPEFTAFSSGARHVLLSGRTTEPVELLDIVGRELIRFRSSGRNWKILGDKDSEKNFKDDHDLMKGSNPRKNHPRRVAFGLPHNYGHQQVGPVDKRLDRRASPLFIHIHECGNTPVAVLSFLPARFLPVDTSGRAYLSVGGSRVPQTPEAELYQPVRDFLDRVLDPEKRKEKSFTSAIGIPS